MTISIYMTRHDVILFPTFFFNDTATTEIYTLSLHDALPICEGGMAAPGGRRPSRMGWTRARRRRSFRRSEEHTSELQSHLNLVCRLLLEKKKLACDEDICAPIANTRLTH